MASAPPYDILLAVFDSLGRPSAEALDTMKACALVNQHWSGIVRSLICDFSDRLRLGPNRTLAAAVRIRPAYRELVHALEYDALHARMEFTTAAVRFCGALLPNLTRIVITDSGSSPGQVDYGFLSCHPKLEHLDIGLVHDRWAEPAIIPSARSSITLKTIRFRNLMGEPKELLKWLAMTDTLRFKTLERVTFADINTMATEVYFSAFLETHDYVRDIVFDLPDPAFDFKEQIITGISQLETLTLCVTPFTHWPMLGLGTFFSVLLRAAHAPALRVIVVRIDASRFRLTPKPGGVYACDEAGNVLPQQINLFDRPGNGRSSTGVLALDGWDLPEPEYVRPLPDAMVAQVQTLRIEIVNVSRGLISELRGWGRLMKIFGPAARDGVLTVEKPDWLTLKF